MKVTKSSGNVFADIGIEAVEAKELAVKADLLSMGLTTMREKKLTQKEAAALCGVDQPTLSKALNGRLDSITIDRIARWLMALGQSVRIDVVPMKRGAERGSLSGRAGIVPSSRSHFSSAPDPGVTLIDCLLQ
jgi:predicted XRE-type DNA-binding protein